MALTNILFKFWFSTSPRSTFLFYFLFMKQEKYDRLQKIFRVFKYTLGSVKVGLVIEKN